MAMATEGGSKAGVAAATIATTATSAGGSNDDVDERTVFVRSLPYTVTDSQLEDYFGEVGPVRNCFTVKQKGAEQHRGFGFVHFPASGVQGAKLKKWRLIVRNLPFMLKEQTLRQLFSPSGFVWEITIPRKPDNSSKGFAFVGFTCKADAEKVKILRDEVKGVPGSGGKSRGSAFVEFTEHLHALVALRVLNNNPETFGAEHRPIVQFAIENSQKLKLRATREVLGRQARNASAGTGTGCYFCHLIIHAGSIGTSGFKCGSSLNFKGLKLTNSYATCS